MDLIQEINVKFKLAQNTKTDIQRNFILLRIYNEQLTANEKTLA